MLFRDQHTIIVPATDIILLGPNPKRKAIIVSAPVPALPLPFQPVPTYQAADDVAVSATGIVFTFTAPANQNTTVVHYSGYLSAGAAPTITANLVLSGHEPDLADYPANFDINTNLALAPNDKLQMTVKVAGAAGTMDFYVAYLPANNPNVNPRVTLSFMGPAVLDNGVNLYAGTLPLVLLDEWIGEAIVEEIHAIASIAGQPISVTEIFSV